MYHQMVPQDCLSEILSLTSPLDASRSCLVSTTFRSASDTDSVWNKFLPSDYEEIVSRLINPPNFSSKKELFLRLCHPLLIDAGSKSFKLEKSSGKKSYILSAKELSITWSNDPMRWCWVSNALSRFSEVAVLRTTDWLEIRGRIRTRMLSSSTNYATYLIMKISDRAYGFDSKPLKMSIEVKGQVLEVTGFLRGKGEKEKAVAAEEERGVAMERGDGWMEIELGEFFSGEDDEEVKMSLREVKGCQLKGGLVIEGIEIRPKSITS